MFAAMPLAFVRLEGLVGRLAAGYCPAHGRAHHRIAVHIAGLYEYGLKAR